jgi:hypothetical protein
MILCVQKHKRASLYDLAKTDFPPSVLQDIITIENQVDISVVCISDKDGHTNSHDNDHELACSVHKNVGSFQAGPTIGGVKNSGNM